jgi:hypothetical protein
MSPDVIAMVDLDLEHRSVTNDIENILRKIEYWPPVVAGTGRNFTRLWGT